MNRVQKMAWMTVICTGLGIVLSATAVPVLYVMGGFPRAWAGLAFLGIAGLAGFAPAIFKKEPGAVQTDERDRLIHVQSTKAGFSASYGVFGLLSMGIWIYVGPDSLISANVLPQIWMIAFITAFFVQALTTLVLYGKGNPQPEGGAA